MKFQVTMKDPDSLYDCIDDAVTADLKNDISLNDEEREAIGEVRQKRARDVAAKWFRYGEYLTVEIDTDAGTATVLPAGIVPQRSL